MKTCYGKLLMTGSLRYTVSQDLCAYPVTQNAYADYFGFQYVASFHELWGRTCMPNSGRRARGNDLAHFEGEVSECSVKVTNLIFSFSIVRLVGHG